MKNCILIVDDEPNVRLNYRITLETEGFEVREASSGNAALQRIGCQKSSIWQFSTCACRKWTASNCLKACANGIFRRPL